MASHALGIALYHFHVFFVLEAHVVAFIGRAMSLLELEVSMVEEDERVV